MTSALAPHHTPQFAMASDVPNCTKSRNDTLQTRPLSRALTPAHAIAEAWKNETKDNQERWWQVEASNSRERHRPQSSPSPPSPRAQGDMMSPTRPRKIETKL